MGAWCLGLFFGAARIGVVVVTLNVRYRAAELDYMLNQAQVRLVVTAAKAGELDLEAFYPGFRATVPTVEHVLFLCGTGAGERSRTPACSAPAARRRCGHPSAPATSTSAR